MKLIDRIRGHFADTRVWMRCEGCHEFERRDALEAGLPHGEDHDGVACVGRMRRVRRGEPTPESIREA